MLSKTTTFDDILVSVKEYISEESNYNFATTCFMSRGLDNHQATKTTSKSLSKIPIFM